MTKHQRDKAFIINSINRCTMKEIKQTLTEFANALGICLKKMAQSLGLDRRRRKATWVELTTILMTDRRRVKKAWKID